MTSRRLSALALAILGVVFLGGPAVGHSPNIAIVDTRDAGIDGPQIALLSINDADLFDALLREFERTPGPPYRSFNLRGVHFVVFARDYAFDQQREWLVRDLQTCAEDRPVVILCAAALPDVADIRRIPNLAAVLAGSWQKGSSALVKQTFVDPPVSAEQADRQPRTILIREGRATVR